MRSEIFVAVFSAMEIADFLFISFSKATYEFLEVAFIERHFLWKIIAVFELFRATFLSVSVSESDEAIAVKIDVQACFVGDSHSPHASPIKTAAKTLAASHFQFFRGPRGSFENKSTAIRVLIAL